MKPLQAVAAGTVVICGFVFMRTAYVQRVRAQRAFWKEHCELIADGANYQEGESYLQKFDECMSRNGMPKYPRFPEAMG